MIIFLHLRQLHNCVTSYLLVKLCKMNRRWMWCLIDVLVLGSLTILIIDRTCWGFFSIGFVGFVYLYILFLKLGFKVLGGCQLSLCNKHSFQRGLLHIDHIFGLFIVVLVVALFDNFGAVSLLTWGCCWFRGRGFSPLTGASSPVWQNLLSERG